MFGLKLNIAPSAKDQEEAAVWRCNLPAIFAFLAIQTQWRVLAQADGSRFWVGLDYGAAEPAFRLEGLTLTPTDWVGLRIIEDAARAALNER